MCLLLLKNVLNKKSVPSLNRINNPFYFINRFKSKNVNNKYSQTVNLPNFGQFELSMKNICKNEEKISKVNKNNL
jgi:hypothetical protein